MNDIITLIVITLMKSDYYFHTLHTCEDIILYYEYQSIMCKCICIVCVDASVYLQYIWEYTY